MLLWLLVLLGLLIVTAGLLGLAFLMIRAARQGASAHEDDLLREARERVGALMERSEALKRRYERATADAPPPTGRTRELTAKVASDLDTIGETWLDNQQRLERARNAEPGAVAEGPVSHALALAQDPGLRKKHEQAMALAKEVEARIAALEEAPIQAVERLDQARALLDKARAAGHRADEVARLDARLAQLDPKPWADPVGVAAEAQTLLKEARDLAVGLGIAIG